MLLTTLEEINALLPTSTVNNASSLLTLTDDAERNYLYPILGDDLYDYLQSEYKKLITEKGSIVVGELPSEEETPVIELIRLCQKPILYFALANNVGVLSVSLNEGGGMNVMETEGFEAADDKRLERFSRDSYKNAYRGIDVILLYLERDAKSENPEFLQKWKQSEYYYLRNEFLFSTAARLKEYMSECRGRQDYIEMIPDIRYCQSAYIAPELGEDFLGAFLRMSVDNSVIPSTPEGAKAVWERALGLLRMALSIYVQVRRSDKRFRFTESEAVLAKNQAFSYIKNHAEFFGDYIKNSPLYDPPKESSTPFHASEKVMSIFDPDDSQNSISTPFGFGVNRH